MEESAINKTVKSVMDNKTVRSVMENQSVKSAVGKISGGRVNVGRQERWLSAIGGSALVFYGLKKRSWSSLALALLGSVFVYRGVTGHCPAYQALAFNTAEKRKEEGGSEETSGGKASPASATLPESGWVEVEKNILIQKEPEAVYAFLKNVENLPLILDHLESVRGKNHRHSHWIAKATRGTGLDWEAETINEKPNQQIAWRAIEGGNIDNLLSVRLEPSGEGTQVAFSLQYNKEQSLLGAAFARLFGDPESLLAGGLDRLKQILETETASSEAAALKADILPSAQISFEDLKRASHSRTDEVKRRGNPRRLKKGSG